LAATKESEKMKGFIILVSLIFLSVPAFTQNEERAAIVFNGPECGFTFDDEDLVGDTLAVRGQYAGGGAGLPSNGSLRCQGTHALDMEKSVAFHEGFCGFQGFFTENVHGVVNKGGNFLFYCNFPKAPRDYEPL
jgi:hypothetical protein